MTSPSSFSDRIAIRLAVYGSALILPPLLAVNVTPSATQLNELLCVFGWGLCLLFANRLPAPAPRRGAITPLLVPLCVLCLAVVGSWTLGSLPTSLALPPLLCLVCAGFVAALGAGAAQDEELDGQASFLPFAVGVVVAGVLSAAVAVIQVWIPRLADGDLIAQSGLPGRAVGNLRQPNHLASLLIWAVFALVPLVEWRRLPRWLGGVLMLFLMYGVFLSGSRTGLWGGATVMVVWGFVDRRLAASTRVALVAVGVFASAWPWVSSHFVHSAIGAAARTSEGDSSHFAIWKNAVEMVRQQPWLGVGWGEFNFAWTLTPFPHRPIAFFDHTHDLPLQLFVELGVPLGLLVLGLLVWALGVGLVRAWKTPGPAGHGARAAAMMVMMIALHSLDEYPLWYAYFLLPAAWIWGFTLGAGPAPGDAAVAPPARSNPLVQLGCEGAGLRWFGGAMVVVAALSTWDYCGRIAIIYEEGDKLPPLAQRIKSGQTSPLFAHHADYADATTSDPPSLALHALDHATHSLLDSRLMMAWATALAESGQTDRARYLVARLKEFRHKTETQEFFAPCEDPTVSPKPFQCDPEPKNITWRDFR